MFAGQRDWRNPMWLARTGPAHMEHRNHEQQSACGFDRGRHVGTGFGRLYRQPADSEPRPLLQALEQAKGCVLLVDEIDKSDAEFESLLLEILSDYQISIPELGTIAAVVKPTVILTSNGERDLSDALKRRCLHLHIGFPEQRLEERIVESRVPGISQTLRRQMVGFIHEIRSLDLKKLPSVSETIDWARVLVLLQASELDTEIVKDTLNVLLK